MNVEDSLQAHEDTPLDGHKGDDVAQTKSLNSEVKESSQNKNVQNCKSVDSEVKTEVSKSEVDMETAAAESRNEVSNKNSRQRNETQIAPNEEKERVNTHKEEKAGLALVSIGDDSLSPVIQTQENPQIESPTGGNIPDNILSPPKSETQTDETNTTMSSSPASDSQLSPMDVPKMPGGTGTCVKVSTGKPINLVANGAVPKSGKPLMSAMNKKLNKTSRSTRPRKSKGSVAMYESEISDHKIGIKLCIKKSDTMPGAAPIAGSKSAKAVAAAVETLTTPSTSTKTPIRKRSRKSKSKPRLDSDDSEYETTRKKERTTSSNSNREKKVSFNAAAESAKSKPPVEQIEWGAKMPEDVLYQIFQLVVEKEGCLPTLFRLGRVCSLWRRVSLWPSLWKSMDLSTLVKEKNRKDLKLKWLLESRGKECTDLNVSNWKLDVNCFMVKLAKSCPNLAGIALAGWKHLTSDHLSYLVDNLKKLERLDLSSINVEMTSGKSAVGVQSLCSALQTMSGRLTHLYLAHNRLAGIPQLVNVLSTHCPNLLLLDLSNVTTQATSHGVLHIEKLQHGCRKLKVLRVTNSHVTLSTASMEEMMDSPGFPDLEELSVAAPTDESRITSDEHLQRILKTSSKLKLLDVRGCVRLTHESLIRLPAWDIKHLFLSGCSVTRDTGSGLELIASKWAHSLIELDLAWANVQQPLDNALRALAEKGSLSPLAHLNLCGSSVSDEAVKDILANCAKMNSINLSSCRGLPRGVKRLMQGEQQLQELREVLKVQMKVKLPSQLRKEEEQKLKQEQEQKLKEEDQQPQQQNKAAKAAETNTDSPKAEMGDIGSGSNTSQTN